MVIPYSTRMLTGPGLGHGDANMFVHMVARSGGSRATEGKGGDHVLEEIYSCAKAGFRPVQEALMNEINKSGKFEVASKKCYDSPRRRFR